jgi:hypothetical protein
MPCAAACPCEESLFADFLRASRGPVHRVLGAGRANHRTLSRRLRTREVCRELDLPYLEVAADDIERLDDLLGDALRALGVDC